ncbi:hypothetical protein [Bosea minatitlanensis]|uniref:Uncharacterized protein n=1 Tax=Bosea minatitlanensis TaxID=128782 RepID=A0ABW0F2C4_9HYPH|nr:hypothetical protein [Bosea minatitlanensis]MCT4492761.1 hypothetical protein [Bosea minatitlanensis]
MPVTENNKAHVADRYPGQQELRSDPLLRSAVEQSPEARRLGMLVALIEKREGVAGEVYEDLYRRAEAYAAHISTFAAGPVAYTSWLGFVWFVIREEAAAPSASVPRRAQQPGADPQAPSAPEPRAEPHQQGA